MSDVCQRDGRDCARDRARIAELEVQARIDVQARTNLTERVAELAGKLAVAEAWIQRVLNEVAANALPGDLDMAPLTEIGTREAAILRAAEALAREHDEGMDACATCDCAVCVAVRGEVEDE